MESHRCLVSFDHSSGNPIDFPLNRITEAQNECRDKTKFLESIRRYLESLTEDAHSQNCAVNILPALCDAIRTVESFLLDSNEDFENDLLDIRTTFDSFSSFIISNLSTLLSAICFSIISRLSLVRTRSPYSHMVQSKHRCLYSESTSCIRSFRNFHLEYQQFNCSKNRSYSRR